MKKLLMVSLFFWAFRIEIAVSDPYKTLGSKFIDIPESVKEITPVTPIKSQDGVGLCYGFSATSLLESFRCKELNLDCTNPSEFLSTFDVTSFLSGNVKGLQEEKGSSFAILENIQKSNRKIAKEECAPFSTLVHQKKMFSADERDGWNFLVKIWKEHKGTEGHSSDCVSCLVDEIKMTLGKVKTPDDQLKNAFKASSLNEFLYKAILPLECLEESKMATIPPFVAKRFPTGNDESSEKALKNKIESLLKSSVPIEMAICLEVINPNKCISAHSVTLFGIKEACKKAECKTLVKLKNSFGLSWQNKNNDGWLDLDTLIKSSTTFRSYDNISWIERP